MQLAWKVDEGSKVRLKDYDPDYVDKYTDRALASAEIEKLSEELGELQQLLAAAQHHSLLIVLQGMDTSGKDGTIRNVMAKSIRRGARCDHLKSLPLANWTMTSSGVCIGSLQAEVSLAFSIAPTMRTCWLYACIIWYHQKPGVATTQPLMTLNACWPRMT